MKPVFSAKPVPVNLWNRIRGWLTTNVLKQELGLCLPERIWFGIVMEVKTGIIMNEINCIKKYQSLIYAT